MDNISIVKIPNVSRHFYNYFVFRKVFTLNRDVKIILTPCDFQTRMTILIINLTYSKTCYIILRL